MSDYLEHQKRITKKFIDFNPVTIQLFPRVEASDGEGGKTKTLGAPREPQRFALIEPGNSGFQEPIKTDDGEQYTLAFMLLGEVTCEFAKNDVFTHGGKEYKILEEMHFNGYERRAVVIRHGW